MKAEEFYKSNYNDSDIMDSSHSGSNINYDGLSEVMDAYFEHRVNEINLNDANDEFNRFEQQCLDNGKETNPYEAFIACFNWIKENL